MKSLSPSLNLKTISDRLTETIAEQRIQNTASLTQPIPGPLCLDAGQALAEKLGEGAARHAQVEASGRGRVKYGLKKKDIHWIYMN